MLSKYRLYISTGKEQIVKGFIEGAHLFDLLYIEYLPGDFTRLGFRNLTLLIDDDTIGTFLNTLWRNVQQISYHVSPSKARSILAQGVFSARHAAACSYYRFKSCDSATEIYSNSAMVSFTPTLDLGTTSLGRFANTDLIALASTLATSPLLKNIALDGRNRDVCGHSGRNLRSMSLGGEPVYTLLCAVGISGSVVRLVLIGCGLSAKKLERIQPDCFVTLTELDVSENADLGCGLAKILGHSENQGPRTLRRFEARGCGPVQIWPLKGSWGATMICLDVTRAKLGRAGSASLSQWIAINAVVLESLYLVRTLCKAQMIICALLRNSKLSLNFRALDLSLNRIGLETVHLVKTLLKQYNSMGKIALVQCDLSHPVVIDTVLNGLAARRKNTMRFEFLASDNALFTRNGDISLERLTIPSFLRFLNLDRTYMGTLALRDLFLALATSKAPYLSVLSLRCTAKERGWFTNKRKHKAMADALAEVIVKCSALEKLYLSGGEGSMLRADLLPALAALEKNRRLRVLDISNNGCGDTCFKALATSLAHTTSLVQILFDGNKLSALALECCANLCTQNEVLEDVKLPEHNARSIITRGGADAVIARKALMTISAAMKQRFTEQMRQNKGRSIPSCKRRPPESAVSMPQGTCVQPLDTNQIHDEESGAKKTLGMQTLFQAAASPAHCMRIFQEIFDSERSYVRDLGVICHVFLAPIEHRGILSRSETYAIFGNIRELHQLHVELLTKLCTAKRSRQHRSVIAAHAQVFAEMVPFLRSYSCYCSRYKSAIELVQKLTATRAKLAKFFAKAINAPECRGLNLESYLIKPPQRLCKYPLFFADLLSNMEGAGESVSREVIKGALQAVQDVASTVNAQLASSGSQQRVIEIWQQNLDMCDCISNLVTPSRYFLVEGDVVTASADMSPKRHHFYLFNDLLVLAKRRKFKLRAAVVPEKYKVKYRFSLVDISVLDAPASMSVNTKEDNVFCLHFEDAHGESSSMHWLDSRPRKADLLIWSDSDICHKLRSELSTRCYEAKMLHQDICRRTEIGISEVHCAKRSLRVPTSIPTRFETANCDSTDSEKLKVTTVTTL